MDASPGLVVGHFLLPARLPSPFFGGAFPLRRSLSNFIFFLHNHKDAIRTMMRHMLFADLQRPIYTCHCAPLKTEVDKHRIQFGDGLQVIISYFVAHKLFSEDFAPRSQAVANVTPKDPRSYLIQALLLRRNCGISAPFPLDAPGWWSSSGVAKTLQYMQPMTCLH